MKPLDFRNETFASLRARLTGLRSQVWTAWIAWEIAHGTDGATTRAVAEGSRIDILTLRPRVTELYQIGALRLADDQPDKSEARYVVRSTGEMEAWADEQRDHALTPQLQMPEIIDCRLRLTNY